MQVAVNTGDNGADFKNLLFHPGAELANWVKSSLVLVYRKFDSIFLSPNNSPQSRLFEHTQLKTLYKACL
jgi:hypothetical protein